MWWIIGYLVAVVLATGFVMAISRAASRADEQMEELGDE